MNADNDDDVVNGINLTKIGAQMCHHRKYLITRPELEETLDQFKAEMLAPGCVLAFLW